MKRKTFVKKLMGLGYSRNEANALAARARRYGVSYAARWKYEQPITAGRSFVDGFRAGLSALGRSIDRFAAELRKCADAAAAVCAALGATSFYKLDPADYEPEPADMWPKENPHLQITRITDVSLVASGGVPLNYGQNCDGETPNIQIMSRADHDTLHQGGWAVAAQIHVAGGADNAD